MATTAIYVRTSTEDQDGGAQLNALLQAAHARGLEVEQYTDIGHSGAKASRPALDRLRADVRHGRVGVVMVTALDRLGRSLKDLIALVEELGAGGAKVVSLREGVDMTTTTGTLMLHIFGAIAQFERALIRERVNAGIAKAQSQGKHCGRPLARGAPDGAAVRALRTQGRSWGQCAAELGASVGAVRRAAART